MIFIVVDLPAPFGPKNPMISLFPAVKEILSTAFCEPYIFVRFETTIGIESKCKTKLMCNIFDLIYTEAQCGRTIHTVNEQIRWIFILIREPDRGHGRPMGYIVKFFLS